MVAEKIEGLAWGPDLPDGRHLLYVVSDNDLYPSLHQDFRIRNRWCCREDQLSASGASETHFPKKKVGKILGRVRLAASRIPGRPLGQVGGAPKYGQVLPLRANGIFSDAETAGAVEEPRASGMAVVDSCAKTQDNSRNSWSMSVPQMEVFGTPSGTKYFFSSPGQNIQLSATPVPPICMSGFHLSVRWTGLHGRLES